MPIVSGNIVRESKKFADTEFPIAFQRALWMRLTENMPGDGELSRGLHQYSGLAAIQEIIGEVFVDRWLEKVRTITARPWGYSFAVNKFEKNTKFIKESVMKKIREVVDDTAQHPNTLLFELLENTTSTSTWDELPFFSTSHTIHGTTTTWSNLVSGTGTTEANIVADFESARALFARMQKRNGLRIYENIIQPKYDIYCPLNLLPQMSSIFQEPKRDGSATQGKFITLGINILPVDRLANDDWYITITNVSRKPFMFFEVQSLEWGWENEFDMARERKWILDGYYDIQYGNAETIIKVDN